MTHSAIKFKFLKKGVSKVGLPEGPIFEQKSVFLNLHDKSATKPSRQPRGFSLLELIIAGGLIAILAILAFSVAGSFIQKARIGKCAENLRQFSAILALYSVEHRNTLPPFREYYTKPDGSEARGTSWRGLLIPYIPALPFDNRSSPNTIDVCPAGWTPEALNPYTYYYAITANSTSAAPRNVASIEQPSRYFVLGDATDVMRITPSRNSTEFAFRHAGRVNLLFLDGHVENRPLSSIPQPGQATTPEYKAFWLGE